MAQIKEQIKDPEKIQLSSEQVANLSDAQFKTLVIRMLTELVEFGQKLDEKMKAGVRSRCRSLTPAPPTARRAPAEGEGG